MLLHWHVLNDRLSHFIVYYRRVNHFDELIEIEDYQQLLVHSKSLDYRFTVRVREREIESAIDIVWIISDNRFNSIHEV